MTNVTLDQSALEAFIGQVVSDCGAAMSVLLTHLGDKLGLYQSMANGDPVSATELAARTGTNERLVHEWLANQAAGGYLTYDPSTDQFRLQAEQAFVLADESSPARVQGAFDMVAAVYQSIDKELDMFRTGRGLTWGDHHHSLFSATDRYFRPGYEARLVQEWIPALGGVHEKLVAGGRVADVGCGYGSTTILMADAYPRSSFVGYDYHEPSIVAARDAAERAGVADRVHFEVAEATTISGPYDLIMFCDCWHDTVDPRGAAEAAKQALGDEGSVMLVEPFAHDRLEDNLNPLGRMCYGASTVICAPCSISDGGPGLGTQAGEARTRGLFTDAGFGSFRRVADTPLNIVYQARP